MLRKIKKGTERKSEIDEVILSKKDNVIKVDFVLLSMVNSVHDWYKQHYQYDYYNIYRKAHTFHLIRFYDRQRFKNCRTLREEREKYLEEVDLYVQMRRDD